MEGLLVNIEVDRAVFKLSINEYFPIGITGIFGHSGAGKTTFLQCISGVTKPDIGVIECGETQFFSKENKVSVPIHKRHIAYVFQEGRLFPHLTVIKNLLYNASKLLDREVGYGFKDVVELLEIKALLEKYPSELSGGERQRVALGRAILSNPDVLLLDEPFSAVDQNLRKQIIPFIANISEWLNIPILLVSHDLPDILKLTDRICVLKSGKVVGHGLYSDLIMNNSLGEVLPTSELLNCMYFKVKKLDHDKGLVTLNGFGEGRKVNVILEPRQKNYKLDDLVKVFLRPDDVVLSITEIIGASSQNQLKGRIVRLEAEGPRVYCYVDCGVLIIAEISLASTQTLNLKIKDEVYCLFKSIALDMAFV